MQHFSPYLLSESPLEGRPPTSLGGIYAAGRTSPRSGPEGRALHAAPDVWLHSSTKRKRAFPVRCAKAAGRRIIILADPGLVKQTVPTDATSGGVEMYRDCYRMKLAYPCEADGCRCGSGCLRTRPDCNRTADEDSYSNCDVIPHSGLHTGPRKA